VRSSGINRNDPKAKTSSPIGQSHPETPAIGSDRNGFSQAAGDDPQVPSHVRPHLQPDENRA